MRDYTGILKEGENKIYLVLQKNPWISYISFGITKGIQDPIISVITKNNENTLAAWRVRRKNLRFSYFGRNVRYKKSVLDLYLKTRNLLQQEKEVFPKEEK